MQQRDYIQRLIEQLNETIGGILGFANSGRVVEAESMLDDAWVSLLGMRRSDAERLDDATLRAMLGERVEIAARLLEARATLQAGADANAPQSEVVRHRVARLRAPK